MDPDPERSQRRRISSTLPPESHGGRYRIRTYDFHRVKMALYR